MACALALLVTWAGSSLAGVVMPDLSLLAVISLSGLGLADDLWGLPAVWRLLGQVAIGATLGAALGEPSAAMLGALVFPIAVNAVNFMDGINGITGLTMGAWALAVLVAWPAPSAVILAALAFGQAVGFLPWNLPRARMFLGDSGSYLFGGLLAAAVLQTQVQTGSSWIVVAPMLVYLFDTGYTLSRRAIAGAPVLAAHREHLYQRIGVARGWGHPRVALLVAALSLYAGMVSIFLTPIAAAVGITLALAGYTWLGTNRSILQAGASR